MSGFVRQAGEDSIVPVRLTPRASAEKIGSLWTDADGHVWLSASVPAPPDKGRANAALILLLAKRLDLPRSSISLEAGDTSRLKRMRIRQSHAAIIEIMLLGTDGAPKTEDMIP